MMIQETNSQRGDVMNDDSFEFNLHVWVKPEDESMQTVYTISRGKQCICIDATIDDAMEALRDALTDCGEVIS
jgi:hypothetical protein